MKPPRSVVTIGNFDGVHIGHAALVGRARELAEGAGHASRVVVLSFDPHPASVLAPGRQPERLTGFEHRVELLGNAGADEVIRLQPTGHMLGQSPEDFVERLVRDLAPIAVVEGPDFRFGRGREGDVLTLRTLGSKFGFNVDVVGPVEAVMTDGTVAAASSSLVRWLLAEGRIGDARAALGRAYEMRGSVVRGERRGRDIGYPTANIRSEYLAPGDGVYGGEAELPDGRRLTAAISVGTKPTFGAAPRTVEAFLMDAPRQEAADGAAVITGLPEYGWEIKLRFDHWIRDQVRFGSLQELLDQMDRDCRRIRELSAMKENAACP